MGGQRIPADERFWRKVVKHDGPDTCWEWIGYIQPLDVHGNGGYGRLRINRRWAWAHRYAYELQCGPLATGECALHTCDNRRCVRGSHLFKGTRTANAADRDAKGRTSKGEKHAEAVRAAWARRKALVTR